jgi:hypothetical protein
MKHFKKYENSHEYEQSIKYNGYVKDLPHMSVLMEDGVAMPNYISDPLRIATYEGPTKLFYDDYNIKKVMVGDEVLYENTNDPIIDTITVTPENLVVNRDTTISHYDPNIFIDLTKVQEVEISVDGGILPSDTGYMVGRFRDNNLAAFGGYFSQILPNGVVKLYFDSGSVTSDNKLTIQLYRDDKPLVTYIKYATIPPMLTEIFHESMKNGIPELPQNTYINVVRIGINVDITSPDIFLAILMDGEIMGAFPGSEMGPLPENIKYFDMPLEQEFNVPTQVGWIRLVDEETEEFVYLDNTITCYQSIDPSSLYSEHDITIKYEPFNRFYPIRFCGTNVTSFNKNANKHNIMTELNPLVYQNCSKLKKLVIPQHIDTIPYEALVGLDSLESITLPQNLEEFHINAIAGCLNLKEIIFLGLKAPRISSMTALEGTNFPRMGVIKIPANSSGYDNLIKELNKHAGVKPGDSLANWTLEYI